MEGAFIELIPYFEKSSGHRVIIKYGPVGALADRLRNGEVADVAILSETAAEKLRIQGTLVAGSEVVIAKVGIGVFVRKGDPKPNISSVDAFLGSLAAAKSIGLRILCSAAQRAYWWATSWNRSMQPVR